MNDCCKVPDHDVDQPKQRRILIIALFLNAMMFFVEFVAGWLADSSSLIADSLDMLADSAVYAISLYAVGRSLKHKAAAALTNGILELSLGTLVFVDIIRRIIFGSAPATTAMIVVGLLALLINVVCLYLLFGYRKSDINLKASWICTRNDVLANLGVILAAGLVAWLNTPWPDWIIAAVIAGVIVRSSLQIIKQAWPQWLQV
ncbi:MAG: cation transporter [Gammaproteobacteria bacterium]|nr:cation transporter [Gammaproteobacteria bacterium]